MKKSMRVLLSAFLACGMCLNGVYAESETEASPSPSPTASAEVEEEDDSLYPMACKVYEVDDIEKDGSFSSAGCYDTYKAAKAAMEKRGDNAVVRHGSSLSPTKIIAMNSGVAFSYPARSGSATLSITQYSGSKTTYTSQHRELHYYATDSYDGKGNGTVHIMVSGFNGKVSLKNVDLVPYALIDAGAAVYLGGNDATTANEQPFSLKPKISYYEVKVNGNYRDLIFHSFSGWNTNGKDGYEIMGVAVGPAPDFMEEGVKYYSWNDVDYYTDREATQLAGTYYNYYMFAPLRTKSNISADVYNGFLTSKGYGESSKLWDTGEIFLECQEAYGMNAAIVFVQACVEAAYGTSYFATARNNLFGWNAVDSEPGRASYYKSIEQAIKEHMGINLRGYMYTNDTRFFGSHLGNKGSGISVKYASAPYYGATLAAVWYSFDKYASGNDGTLTDYDSMGLGVIRTFGAKVYDEIDGSVLYTMEYGATYQINHTVSILEEKDGWYRIQSTNYLDEDGVVDTAGMTAYLEYDWDEQSVWISKDDVERINDTKVPVNNTVHPVTMYRLYNPNSGEHFYTSDTNERGTLIELGWMDELIGWIAPDASETPVYRLYNKNAGDHHYTMDVNERDTLIELGWSDEGIGWYSDDNETVPLYRQYNPNAVSGSHNYTTDKHENDVLVELGWNEEGIGWYAMEAAPAVSEEEKTPAATAEPEASAAAVSE